MISQQKLQNVVFLRYKQMMPQLKESRYSPKHVPAVPNPVYPAIHLHVKLPAGVFKHTASASSQLCVSMAHSSISK